MKFKNSLIIVGLTCFVFMSRMVFANCCCSPYCYCGVLPNALQIALIANDGMSIGLVHYDEYYSYGVNVAGNTGKLNNRTSHTFSPAIFGGLRWHINEPVYLGLGVDLTSTYGKKEGYSIKRAVGTGPYFQIDYQFPCHVILSAWINPYFYNYEKIGDNVNKTNSFFNTGGLGVSYFFN